MYTITHYRLIIRAYVATNQKVDKKLKLLPVHCSLKAVTFLSTNQIGLLY
ncbi:MAG: hypothetical protein F6K22_27725 [Okeania sp. SIO2F4]|nr:hypothetical protein [Okeania sp. SIO2F4]NES06269.1 hypothetical protein [Okeania sp. SIO2F4]